MNGTLCILTSGRPKSLTRLLDSIVSMKEPPPEHRFNVLVVDNHPDQSARAVVELFADRLSIRYEFEARRGIPFARNTAIELVSQSSEFIAFVDDDETVDPNWLNELVDVQQRYEADVVTGPTLSQLPADAPHWLAQSGAFDLLRYETGVIRPVAYTGNVLVKREVFEHVQPHFDERLVKTGGSDAHFFRRVHDAGFSIIWADDAITREWIPMERVSVRWLMRRALRVGGISAFIERDLTGASTTMTRLPFLAGRYMLRGLFRFISCLWRGRAGLLAGARDWCHAFGMLAGLLGYRHREYIARTRS